MIALDTPSPATGSAARLRVAACLRALEGIAENPEVRAVLGDLSAYLETDCAEVSLSPYWARRLRLYAEANETDIAGMVRGALSVRKCSRMLFKFPTD